MSRRSNVRLIALVALATVAVAAGCAGPVGVGSLPVSGSSWVEDQVYTCLDSPGRLRVAVDSTEATHPDIVKVEISDDQVGGEELYLSAQDPLSPSHFEGASTQVHPAGSCPHLRIKLLCVPYASDCAREWQTTARSFTYAVSLAP